jgi:predicted Fe-S protein YdhL (DUF1289 family)
MDPGSGCCLGCARTLEEIARWGGMDEEERARIMDELPARKKALDIPEVSVPPLA